MTCLQSTRTAARAIEYAGAVEAPVLHRIADLAKSVKRRSFELLQLEPGQRVLDVGCGPGIDTVAVARAVGPAGLVVGVDHDRAMIAEANERARAEGVRAWTRHELADAVALPFRSGSFDRCRCERLLQHLADPRRGFAELVRVTKPGGIVAVADTDWGTLSIDAEDTALERRVVQGVAATLRSPYAGRQLVRFFADHRLRVDAVEVHPVVWTDYVSFRDTSFSLRGLSETLEASRAVGGAELRAFHASLERAQHCGAFFASGGVVLVVGARGEHG